MRDADGDCPNDTAAAWSKLNWSVGSLDESEGCA